MLQGNPFETQAEVRDRTNNVRHDMELGRSAGYSDVRARIEGWWETMESSFDLRNLGTPSLETLRAAWWLPAGIAIAFLLSVFISQ